MLLKTCLLTLIGLLLIGCAELPKFDTTQVDTHLLPTQVAASPALHKGKKVLWGGTILSGKNLKDTTQLEILAYPLDEDGWPQRDQKPLGRFILTQPGYLETADYATGRLVTAVGTISGTKKGKVGDSDYKFPLIQARQLHLWKQMDKPSGSRFHFGIGVMVH